MANGNVEITVDENVIAEGDKDKTAAVEAGGKAEVKIGGDVVSSGYGIVAEISLPAEENTAANPGCFYTQ